MPITLGFLWLLIVRLVDPLPRAAARLFGRRRTARGDDLPRRDRLVAGCVALAVAATTFLLIEYGIAIAANPPGARRIIWVQGRYFLPLLPLTLFAASRPTEPVKTWWLMVFPVISITLTLWWMWWTSANVWHWF